MKRYQRNRFQKTNRKKALINDEGIIWELHRTTCAQVYFENLKCDADIYVSPAGHLKYCFEDQNAYLDVLADIKKRNLKKLKEKFIWIQEQEKRDCKWKH